MSKKEEEYLKLMEDNRNRIYRIASIYCNNRQDIKDLSQEIAYQVWKSFDSFRAESEMSTWLYRIALNTAIQFLKREKRHLKPLSYQLYEFDTCSDEKSENKDLEIKQLMHAIQGLKELDKAIILLYLEEKSHSEIASILNLSITNVSTRIQRIKKKLKTTITDQKHGYR